jgi:hypothetical protein
MLVLRISDEELRAWLDCDFCGLTNEVPFQAHIRHDVVPKRMFPDADALVVQHFALDKRESFGFAPCSRPPTGACVTNWQVTVLPDGSVLEQGVLEFFPHATTPRAVRLPVADPLTG